MNLLRRLYRRTARYWTRRHGVTRDAAVDLADLAAWYPRETDGALIDRRAYELADRDDPDHW